MDFGAINIALPIPETSKRNKIHKISENTSIKIAMKSRSCDL